jgi:hypothetical protein
VKTSVSASASSNGKRWTNGAPLKSSGVAARDERVREERALHGVNGAVTASALR